MYFSLKFIFRNIPFLLSFLLVIGSTVVAQPRFCLEPKRQVKVFSDGMGFVENIGQYGEILKDHDLIGKIKYGFEGFKMPVLITKSGIAYLQRELTKSKKRNRNETAKDKEESRYATEDKEIIMEWLGANPDPQVIAEDQSQVYHTYGLFPAKARLFHKLIFKELYPGIDLIFSFDPLNEKTFEFSFLIRPGADIKKILMRYGGDITKIRKDKNGNLKICTSIDGITQTAPVGYYQCNDVKDKKTDCVVNTLVNGNIVSYSITGSYDKSKTFIIDPFVSPLTGFTGPDANIACDIDFDYAGNVYARGGGDVLVCELAKFDPSGNLKWIFHGSLSTPMWQFGALLGGWMVEKNTGKIYAGNGGGGHVGTRIIRLDSMGLYDNYITINDYRLDEAWKILRTCNGSSPVILVAGGGTLTEMNLGLLFPPSTTIGVANTTGVPGAPVSQDYGDAILDPVDNAMYSIFCSVEPTAAASLNNKIIRFNQPYFYSNIIWGKFTGYNSLQEVASRPYLPGGSSTSSNVLAVNQNYLFYWDGKYLKAFDKSNGNTAGAPLTTSNTAMMQGGIAADPCDNVFVGDVNGTIKVYHFDGSSFDDSAAPDILIPGHPSSSTYALAYDHGRKLLYACGDGYVASFDVASYCSSQLFSINLNASCLNSSVNCTVTPQPPPGSTITYYLYLGATLVSSNTTGLFSSLIGNTNYKIRATLNEACGGTRFEKDFVLLSPSVTTTTTPSTCTQNIGTITASGSSGTAPYTYSLDALNFQSSNVFSNVAVGAYTVTIKDANGCTNSTQAIVGVSGVNTVTLNAGNNQTICEGAGATINATSNASNFLWTPATGLNNPTILNPVASPRVTTKYYITATSAPCSRIDSVIVFVNKAPTANAGSAILICSGKSAQLNGSGGIGYQWAPVTYLDNPGLANPYVLQPSSSITYSLTVTDALGCRSILPATVLVSVAPPGKIGLPSDTVVAMNQPVQLNATDVNNTGFIQYIWTPTTGLNNPYISNPVAVLDQDIQYTVVASTNDNCKGQATINIKVYKGPDIYVPNSFTPNNDQLNDVVKAFPVGLQQFNYFAIYDRYGYRVFFTANSSEGWNGKIGGLQQGTNAFVWIAEGIDFKGNIIKRSGSLILIR